MCVGSLDTVFWVGTLFFLIPYNLLMYGLNDVFDYESDMKNPRKGGVEGAILPKKYHRVVTLTSSLAPIPFILWLVLHGSLQANIVLLAALFFVVAYSAKGLRFKEIPFVDSVTSSMHFAGPLVYALALAGFPAGAWPYVLAFFLWGMASHAFGAIQDIIPDREADIRSIATILGARTVIFFTIACYLAAFVLIVLQGPHLIAVALCALLYAVNAIDFITVSDKTSARTRAGWKRFLWMNYLTGAIATITIVVWVYFL